MDAKPTRLFFRYAAAIVFIVLATLAVAGCLIARSATQNSERRLLHERAAEIGALLANATGSAKTSLGLLSETYAAGGVGDGGLRAGARSLAKGGVTTVGIAQTDGDRVVVRAEEGTQHNDTTLTGARAELMRRAARAKDLASAIIKDAKTGRSSLVLAVGRADGIVAFEESVFDP